MNRNRKTRSARRKPAGLLVRWSRRLAFAIVAVIVVSFVIVLPLRWVNPTTTMFMLADDSGVEPLRHAWVDWEALGDAIVLAVVAAEDQRFADHRGIDFVAIQKAVNEQDERGYLRGASTITQQTVKNLYLWSGRSFLRKGLEAWLTLIVEICLPKKRILEIYLNIAEFGPGTYGAGAASRHFYGLAPAQLGDRRAALLAAVLPNPRQLHVALPSQYVRERAAWIRANIARLRREAWITRMR